MRKLLSLSAILSVCLFVLCFAVKPAHAGSFTMYNLGTDAVHVMGIDASGTVLLQQFQGCNGLGGPNFCYEEFTNGALVYRDDVAPAFSTQNGSSCAAPTGLTLTSKSVCDGDYGVAGGQMGDLRGVWESQLGSGSVGDYVYFGTADQIYLNSAGDFAAVDGLHDTLYQVVAQTPEPSSLLLLATGAVGLYGAARRRLQSNA